MKKFFIIIAVILGLLIIGIAVFALTFDANRYKGALITSLEKSMDRDVKIDSMSLSILHGLGFEIKGIAVKDKDKTWDDFLLKAKSLTASVKILPLLKKDIQVQRLLIPELEINAGGGANSPVFRCSLILNAHILINKAIEGDTLKALSARGNVKLENAVLDNVNVLAVMLDKLNMLPDLVQKLKNNLPEKYSNLLSQNYTAFKPMNANFEIRDSRIWFDKLLVESDAFYFTSHGSVGMVDQDIEISADLFIPKDLSVALINTAPELECLTDDSGLIEMPFEVKGKIPGISVMPDLNYVLHKIISSKGQKLLNKLFRIK